jgi:hypothetical protein
MSTPTATETVRNGHRVGERRELARYTAPGGERIIYGQRVDGVVRLADVPANPGGRAYLIERELEKDGYDAVKALVSDYLARAARLGEVPMAISPLERYLDPLEGRAIMNGVAEAIDTDRVHVSGAVEGRYVIRDRRPDGELVIAPDTSWEAISERAGGEELMSKQWDEFIVEHGSEMLPPDGEG